MNYLFKMIDQKPLWSWITIGVVGAVTIACFVIYSGLPTNFSAGIGVVTGAITAWVGLFGHIKQNTEYRGWLNDMPAMLPLVFVGIAMIFGVSIGAWIIGG